MDKVKKTQRTLLAINALKIVLTIFTTTFFTSYIVALTPDNILGQGVLNIGIFYLSQFVVYMIVYFVLSKFVAKSNRVSYLRLGILVNGILLVALIFFGNEISKWLPLAGGLIGIADAFYNSSYLVMKNELVRRKNINFFNISSSVITNLINVVVPILLGYLIDVSTFSHIAIYVVVIVVVQFGISFLISSQRPPKSDFKLSAFFSYLKQDQRAKKSIKWTYLNAIFAGFKNTYKVIIVILTIYIFKTNLNLGILTSIFSITTTILLVIFKKFEYHPKMNKLVVYMIVGFFPVLACLGFVFLQEKISLIVLNLALTIAIQFSEYGSNCERDAIIKNLNKYEFIAQHQFMCEALMCASRVFSYIIFIVVGLFADITFFTILLIILIGLTPTKFFIMFKQTIVRKKLEEEKEQELENQASLSITEKTTATKKR